MKIAQLKSILADFDDDMDVLLFNKKDKYYLKFIGGIHLNVFVDGDSDDTSLSLFVGEC